MSCSKQVSYLEDERYRPLTLSEWDAPCLNCGRFGTIPGQMITDSFNNTFCSPDCGWSHLLRPIEQHRAAKAAAAAAAAAAGMQTGAAPRTRRPSRRSSRSSRHAQQLQQQQLLQQRLRHKQASQSSGKQYDDSSRTSSSRRPPRAPASTRSNRKLEAWEIARSRCQESGNAMFDFMMMFGSDTE